MKHIHYSNEQIERLSKDTRIKHIDQYSIRFTLEYRLSIYERIKDNICTAAVRQILLDDGFDLMDFKSNKYFLKCIAQKIKLRKPCGAKNEVFSVSNFSNVSDSSYNQFLLETGKFIKKNNGISFSEEYKSKIYHSYPETTVEDLLTNDGFDIARIGYQRIYNLIREFNGEVSSTTYYSDDLTEQLKGHIYVKTVTHKQLRLRQQFYEDAYHLSSLHIDKILNIFEINHLLIPVSNKKRIESKILNQKKFKKLNDIDSNEQYVRIQRNINKALTALVEGNFRIIKKNIHLFTYNQRIETVKLINDLYRLDGNDHSITQLCNRCGISRSHYYHILNNDGYGRHQWLKEQEDNNYIKTIKKIVKYKGYPKGSRMIYMMQDKFGMHISRNKIIRLCRKGNIICNVRKGNKNRKAANELIDRNVKTNLVKRQFKLDKPNKIYLTDVTYIKYAGRTKTAYLSDVKDAVTGKSICHALSKNNDLILAQDTLDRLPAASDGAVFHSDQGILYLNDIFQLKLKESGYLQSMSKRGNCWDNAPKESQYGHMKDEVIFSDIQTFDELKTETDKYYEYYNNERPQWGRNKMTPVEYEKHLISLTDEEYNKYIDTEREKYDNMMDKAAKKAIKRAGDLKAQ